MGADASQPKRARAAASARLLLGASLAGSGWMGRIAVGVAILTTLGGTGLAMAMVRQGEDPPARLVAGVAAQALAWGAGVLLAFGAAVHALRTDREQGVRTLLAMRGVGRRRYLWSRLGGLAASLVVIVGGGSSIVAIATALAAPSLRVAGNALLGTPGALVYSLAFGAVLSPIAFAALGARSRGGGYVALLLLLFVPELFAGAAAGVLPRAWDGLLSIPGALDAIRASLLPGSFDLLRAARALLVLTIFFGGAVALVSHEAKRVDREPVA